MTNTTRLNDLPAELLMGILGESVIRQVLSDENDTIERACSRLRAVCHRWHNCIRTEYFQTSVRKELQNRGKRVILFTCLVFKNEAEILSPKPTFYLFVIIAAFAS
jgi:hypothetical protein